MLAGGEAGPVDIAIDSAHSYWSNSSESDRALVRIDHDGAAAPRVLIPQIDTGHELHAPGPLVLNAETVFLLDRAPGGYGPYVYSVTKTGGTPLPFGLTNDSPRALVVTDTHAVWLNVQQDLIEQAPLGSNEKDGTFAVAIAPGPLALLEDTLFFATDDSAAGVALLSFTQSLGESRGGSVPAQAIRGRLDSGRGRLVLRRTASPYPVVTPIPTASSRADLAPNIANSGTLALRVAELAGFEASSRCASTNNRALGVRRDGQ